MDRQHDGPADGSRSGGEPDAWRFLLAGLLEKLDAAATGFLGDEAGGQARDGAGATTAAADFAGQFRATLEIIVEEAGELIWQMLAQLIAILEAVQVALEHVMGSPASAGAARPSTAAGGARENPYEPITVSFDSPDAPDEPPTGQR